MRFDRIVKLADEFVNKYSQEGAVAFSRRMSEAHIFTTVMEGLSKISSIIPNWKQYLTKKDQSAADRVIDIHEKISASISAATVLNDKKDILSGISGATVLNCKPVILARMPDIKAVVDAIKAAIPGNQKAYYESVGPELENAFNKVNKINQIKS